MITQQELNTLLNSLRQHFEATTNLPTRSTKIKLYDEDWFESHQEVQGASNNALATCKNYDSYSIIVIRQSRIESIYQLIISILHELTHHHIGPHNDEFYNILSKTGVYIGHHTGFMDYRIEGITQTIKDLA